MTTKAKKAPLSLLTTLLTTLFILALAATSASAARPHEFSKTFGAKCLAEPGCTGEDLFSPNGVAVNEATGDVYVVDKGEGAVGGRVVRFNNEGVVQGEFNGSEAETGVFEEPETIAVDNSCVLRKLKEPALTQAKCEAEDPSNGDVYVVDTRKNQKTGESPVVDKFSATGGYLGQISEAGEGGSLPFKGRPVDGVAVDPSGKLWIYRQEAGAVVDGFSNATANEFVPPQIGLPLGQAAPGFAVDSIGSFYGNVEVHVLPQIAKWGPAGNLLIESLDGEGSTAVAVDESTDASFVDKGASIGAFSSEGAPLERLGKEGGAKHLVQGVGIGVNASSESLYVADAGTGTVVVFGPAQATAPKVAGESFSKVGSDRARVAAEIEPRSEAGEAATEYHFEYGRCATLDPGSCKESGYEANTANGLIPSDFAVHTVAAQLEGLQPHTTYHFRAVATNSHPGGEPGAEVTFTTEAAGGELALPDNRGWELVSPPDKQGTRIEPLEEVGVVQAAAGGDGVTYIANSPTESQPQGNTNRVQVLSTRSATSWSSRDIAIPHSSSVGVPFNGGAEYKFFDPELTFSAVHPFGEFIPQLSAEASESTAYLHNLEPTCGASCYRPLVTGKSGFANVPAGTVFGEESLCQPAPDYDARNICGPQFVGATDDLSHVIVNSATPLTPGALPNELYEWSGGTLAPVSVLPDKEAAGHAELGGPGVNGWETVRHAISSHGNRIAWTAKGNLYERDMARGETVQLDEAEAVGGEPCTECESGGGVFQIASVDGSRVFFTDTHRLTKSSGADNTAGSQKADLYECQVVVEANKLMCELEDLTPANGLEGASVQGGVLGASEDGSAIYFVAEGVLSEAANARDQKARSGQPNLYVHEDGGTRFIATLESEDVHDWWPNQSSQPTRVSGNGRYLELMSQAQPTGYDNSDRATGKAVAEVYLYDAATNRLSCASCEPTGARPVGVEYIKLEPAAGLVGGRNLWQRNALVAANVPGWTSSKAPGESFHQPRYLNNEGRLFFNTLDALVPQDSNGTQDVYEYEPPGVGGCSEADSTYSARSGGCVSLISSGASAQESAFLDASESGDDVFFLTSAKLSPLDVDAARDVYDAHVCSSASPCISYAGNETPPCTTEASCKPSPTPQPSIFGAPASSTFQGLGNPAAAAAVKPKAKPLTRAQKLAAALKGCRKTKGNTKQAKAKRAKCEAKAHKQFGPLKRAKKKRQ
jgi:DNA-binding beta-propeller fold protein YncE